MLMSLLFDTTPMRLWIQWPYCVKDFDVTVSWIRGPKYVRAHDIIMGWDFDHSVCIEFQKIICSFISWIGLSRLFI